MEDLAMNNQFNLRRFGLLLRHEWATTWILITAYTAMMIMAWLVALFVKADDLGTTTIIFWPAVMLFIMPLFVSAHTTDKRAFLPFTVVPASNIEKFCCRMLLFWVLPALVFIVFEPMRHFIQLNEETALLQKEMLLCGNMLTTALVIGISLVALFAGALFNRLKILFAVLMTGVLVILFAHIIEHINLMFTVPFIEYYNVANPVHSHALVLSLAIVMAFFIVFVPVSWVLFKRKSIYGISSRKK